MSSPLNPEINLEINTNPQLHSVNRAAVTPGSPLSYVLQSSHPQFQELLVLAETVAKSKATVLIQGDSGSGKNILAKYIFQKSQRNHKGYLVFRCKEIALGQQMAELETILDRAMGGTLLLTDVTYLGLPAQEKLLDAIQRGVDIRWIATTSRSLAQLAKGGDFREDLFYRLNVVSLKIPSLVDRMGDIESLARILLEKAAKTHGKLGLTLSPEAIQLLNTHRWPGNLRELESVIERAVLVASSSEIRARDIQIQNNLENRTQRDEATFSWKPGRTLDEIERQVILEALKFHSGNRTHTAKALGISIRTLRNKLAEYRVMGIQA